jgi:hypothetical protein
VNHPFYAAWRATPIEVVLSGDAAYGDRMLDTLKKLGKVPIITADVPCFAADDIFSNYIVEAVRIVEEGIATPAQVDKGVNDAIGGGGPFNVMDGTRGNLLVKQPAGADGGAPGGTAWFAPPACLAKQGNTPWRNPKAIEDTKTTEEQKKVIIGPHPGGAVGALFCRGRKWRLRIFGPQLVDPHVAWIYRRDA